MSLHIPHWISGKPKPFVAGVEDDQAGYVTRCPVWWHDSAPDENGPAGWLLVEFSVQGGGSSGHQAVFGVAQMPRRLCRSLGVFDEYDVWAKLNPDGSAELIAIKVDNIDCMVSDVRLKRVGYAAL